MGFLKNLIHRIFPSTVVYKHKGDRYNPVQGKYRMVDAVSDWKEVSELPIHDKVNVLINITERFQENGQVGKLSVSVNGFEIGLYVERCTPKYIIDLTNAMRKLYDACTPVLNLDQGGCWGEMTFKFPFPTGYISVNMFKNSWNLKHDSDVDHNLRLFLLNTRHPATPSILKITYAELIADPDGTAKMVATYKQDADEKEIKYYASMIAILKEDLDACSEPWLTEIEYDGVKVLAATGAIYDDTEIRITDLLWMPGTTIHLPHNIVWSQGTVMKQHALDTIFDLVPTEYREEVRKRVMQ